MEHAKTPSPCIQVCELDADDVCLGCGRTVDEIARWAGAGEREKQAIVESGRDRLAGGSMGADRGNP